MSFVLFLFAIVWSVLLRFTDSDYTFGFFKLFFSEKYFIHGEIRLANSKYMKAKCRIRVIIKLPNTEQSPKEKVKQTKSVNITGSMNGC